MLYKKISILSLFCITVVALSSLLSCNQKEEPTYLLTKQSNPVIKIDTNLGAIYAELFEEKAPITVENFLKYTEEKFYDKTVFHRVIRNFMIQGGGCDAEYIQKKTGKSIKNEAYNGIKNMRGTLAMARTQVIDSATSQFFINVSDNNFLDHQGTAPQRFGYAVFGKVIDGMDVVDAIHEQKTTERMPFKDVPVESIHINSVRIVKK